MKISIFLGREHHAHKLMPVAQKFQQAGWEVDFLITDNSINIDPSEAYLSKFNIINFSHVKDFIYDNTMEKVNEKIAKIDINKFSEIFLNVPAFWVLSSLREASMNLELFGDYFYEYEPDAILALHEQNFFVKTLFYLASQWNISTYSLMEGIILNREEIDLDKYKNATEYTNTLFSWSIKDPSSYSDQSRIVPVGPSHMDDLLKIATAKDGSFFKTKYMARQKMGINNSRPVILFAPPRSDLYRGDLLKAIRFVDSLCNRLGATLLVSFHPFEHPVVVRRASELIPHRPIFDDHYSLDRVFVADLLITQTSTIAVEAALMGVAVAEIDLDYMGIEQTVVDNQFISSTINNQAAEQIITNLLQNRNSPEFASSVDELRETYLADGNASQRIVDYVLENQ